MMNLIADLHTHTIASGHAFGTIREMAQAAAEQNLHILGVTEHAPGIPGTCHPIYFRSLKCVPKVLSGVRVLHGCEVNVLEGGKLSLDPHYMVCLDYLIAGIHSMCYDDQGSAGNTKNVIGCMEADPRVRFISHPDDSRSPLDYETLVKAAKDLNVALEVNNSSLLPGAYRLNAHENYKTMLRFCETYGVNIIVNTDAHDPSAVGRFDAAISLLESVHFPEELILNSNEEKLLKFMLG